MIRHFAPSAFLFALLFMGIRCSRVQMRGGMHVLEWRD